MSSFWASLAIAAILAVLYNFFKPRPLRNIRGPPTPSFFAGNEREIRSQTEVGSLDFKWLREYGAAWRVAGCFGEDVLMLADAKALQYLFHTSGYHYPKKKDIDVTNSFFLGRGIVTAGGEVHQRHRKVMNPAFSAPQLREFLPFFRRSAARLSQKWKDELQNTDSDGLVLNVNRWMARTALDVIGEAAFDYRFDAIDNGENQLSKTFENLFADSLMNPPARELMFKSFWRYLPRSVIRCFRFIPTREHLRFRGFLSMAKRIAKKLVAEKTAAALENKGGKDIMSILVQSNNSEDPSRRLDDDEVLSQMATLMLAGHETTASSMSWLLYELSKHPEDQSRVREEIAAARAKVVARGDDDFTVADLDGMVFTNAVMKEAMRIHPIVPHLCREAGRDDTIPLSTPIEIRSGEMVSEIPIRKGQVVLVSICAYNRLESVWGKDADEWRPERFLETDQERATYVGVYSSLLIFSAGIKACIGWRFSVIEMQALLTEAIENFRFSLPSEKVEIQRVHAVIMIPMVKGRFQEGTQLPLRVSTVQ